MSPGFYFALDYFHSYLNQNIFYELKNSQCLCLCQARLSFKKTEPYFTVVRFGLGWHLALHY